MTGPPTVAAHVYKAFVYLYPPAFRRQFSFEMVCDVRDATCDVWQEGGWVAVLLLWIQICRDLVRTAAAQWLRSGPSIVLTLAAASAGICGFAISRIAWRPFRPASLSPIDQDKAVLLFLATMVILLAVIVILFTVCFWLPAPRRSGRARRV
jgi:hypothetical protein